jgi:Holliday junction resolvase RusA-like endonuclease
MIEIRVVGLPKTAGSKKAFKSATTNRIIVVDDSGKPGKQWRATVQAAARAVYSGELLDVPLKMVLNFYLPRPKSHYDAKGRLKEPVPLYHRTRPDACKLTRAVEDALTGVLWTDDALIAESVSRKFYCVPGTSMAEQGVLIEVTRL